MHFPALKSDHMPSLLQMTRVTSDGARGRPFCFLVNWLADNSFKGVMVQSWEKDTKWK